MPFMHGTKARVLANGYDLSPWMQEGAISGMADAAESTTWTTLAGVQQVAKTFVAGLRDATFSGTAILDPTAGQPTTAAGAEDAGGVFETALAGDVLLVHMPQGGAFGGPAKSLFAKSSGVEMSTPVSDVGKVTLSAQAALDVGAGVTLHDHTLVEAAGANSITLDQGAVGMPTLLGGIGVVEINGKTGGAGTLTVKIQHSVDGSVWVDLIIFTGQTTHRNAERIAVAGTVNRYLRSLWTQTGGSWQFHTSFARYPTIV